MPPAQHDPTERRKGRRFSLRAPVFFTVWTSSGTSVTRSGITRDVGPGGLFFRTDASLDLAPERRVNVRLLIPREGASPSQAPVALSAEARVVRTERVPAPPCANGAATNGAPGSGWGIAVQFIGRPTVDLASLFFAAPPSPN
jgi:hypothetical protein